MSTKTTLYALGSNGSFQLGIGHDDDVSSPQKCRFAADNGNELVDHVPLDVDDGERIRKIVAGGNHTLLLTTCGRVWTTGSNEVGQCGWTAPGQVQVSAGTVTGTWRRVQWNRPGQGEVCRFTDVAATWTASYFVVDGQILYSCGRGEKGELGIGLGHNDNLTPTQCFDLSDFESGVPYAKIETISSCMNHVVVLSSSGKLYGWGACRKGQLGENLKNEKVIWLPKSLDTGSQWKPRQVVTGREFTFVIGERFEEQCFLGDADRAGFGTPIVLEDEWQQDFEVHAGWTHIVVRVGDGNLREFGRNPRGQLLERTLGDSMARFVMGSEHSLAVTCSGTAIAWGWGEHGNCGSEVDEKKNVVGRYNTLFSTGQSARVSGVGAGCATSFFWVENSS